MKLVWWGKWAGGFWRMMGFVVAFGWRRRRRCGQIEWSTWDRLMVDMVLSCVLSSIQHFLIHSSNEERECSSEQSIGCQCCWTNKHLPGHVLHSCVLLRFFGWYWLGNALFNFANFVENQFCKTDSIILYSYFFIYFHSWNILKLVLVKSTSPVQWTVYTGIKTPQDICLKVAKLKLIKKKKIETWRCGGSNPVPLACKASALPFELHPRRQANSLSLLKRTIQLPFVLLNSI